MPVSSTTSVELLVDLEGRGEPTKGARLQAALRDAVREGRLEPGRRLPSTRALAEDLALSRGVVVDAYEQLIAEGYLVAARGSGTRVSLGGGGGAEPASAPTTGTRWLVSFDTGQPDLRSFPRSGWASAVRAALREMPDDELGYGDMRGVADLRGELASYLARVRGADLDPDRIVIGPGFTAGIGLLARVLRSAGQRSVIVEDPGAYVQRRTIEAAGIRGEPVDVDRDGARTDRLTDMQSNVVLLTPAHQYPTGAVLSAARRGLVIEWARARPERIIIEDDYDAEFRYDRQPVGCLQGLLPDRVVLGGSVSKALAPGLRLGWLALPAGLASEAVERHTAEALQPSVVSQRALARILASGAYDQHIRRSRLRYRRRRDVLVETLGEVDGLELWGIAAGLHLVVALPPEVDETDLATAVARRGVLVRRLAEYRHRPGGPGLVLGYAHLRESEVVKGATVVRDVLRQALD